MDSLWVDFGGVDQPGGWFTINIDGVFDHAPNLVADFTASADQLSAYFAPQSISRAQCIHTLEHIPFPEVLPTLRYWRTFMQPGAPLLIVVPDMEYIVHTYGDKFAPAMDFETLMGMIYVPTEWQKKDDDHHRYGYSAASLSAVLKAAGYRASVIEHYPPSHFVNGFAVKNLAVIGEK